MTTTHDTSISWMECPVCGDLYRELEQEGTAVEKAWATYSSLDMEYRMAMDDARLGFGSTAWRQWRDLLDQILQQYHAAEDAKRASIKAWGDSICEHDVQPQPTGPEEPAEAPAETECGFPETTVWAYDAEQVRCRAFQVGGMIATAAACAKAHRDGYLTGLKEARDLLDGIIADHDEDTDVDEACTHEDGA